MGIEQFMRKSKLVTTHKPRQQRIRSGKYTRKGKITLHLAQGDDNTTYLDTLGAEISRNAVIWDTKIYLW